MLLPLRTSFNQSGALQVELPKIGVGDAVPSLDRMRNIAFCVVETPTPIMANAEAVFGPARSMIPSPPIELGAVPVSADGIRAMIVVFPDTGIETNSNPSDVPEILPASPLMVYTPLLYEAALPEHVVLIFWAVQALGNPAGTTSVA
jgi:hypothetical protein